MAQQPLSDSIKPNLNVHPATFGDVVAVPVASVDTSRRLRLVNESFCRLLGHRVDDVLGKSLGVFGDSEFGNALSSIPIEYVLAESESRDFTFYAGQIGGQDIQIVCSVAHLAGDVPAQVLLVARADHHVASALPAARSVVTLPAAAGEDGLGSADLGMEAIDGLSDVFVLSLTNRSLRRMLDQVFGHAQQLLHVDAMAVYAPFTIQMGQAHAGKVIYASDEATGTLLAGLSLLDGAVVTAVAEGQSHVYCVGAGEAITAPGMPAAWLVAPMQVNNDIIGLTVFLFGQAIELPPNVDELVVSLAQQAMVAYGADRLQRLAGTAASLHERERLAREMHDAVMQSVYSLTLFAEAGRRLAALGQIERVEENLQMLSETAQQALSEMRLLLYELKPAVLEQAGLVEALRQRLDAVERRTGMIARLEVEGSPQLAAPLEDGLYRVCHEALNNTLKHSLATEVTVTLRVDEENALLKICDNGIGFDLGDPRALNGEGIATMRERVRRMNGKLVIESFAQQGTCVNVMLTLTHQFDTDA